MMHDIAAYLRCIRVLHNKREKRQSIGTIKVIGNSQLYDEFVINLLDCYTVKIYTLVFSWFITLLSEA